MLTQMNGFYAFESALHVFPSGEAGLPGRSLEEWNSKLLWRESYGHLMPEVTFFAEDIFGGQFAVGRDGVVYSFNPETAAMSKFSEDVASWQDGVIADWNYVTGYSVGHEWQMRNGPLPPGHRLVPKIPFSVGGEFSFDNMIPVEAAAALRYWGGFALAISESRDGDQFKFNPEVIEKLGCGMWSPTGGSVCHCFA
ncbi:SMI1/KNR4 family protein [Streptomyces sp. NPDC048340]|uniref:SMI1/KNR4 family protein n=1 Tax=Streptomyces sp. NPDC048340 TaxID=3365537 RepID=UPI00371E1839